MGKKRHSAEEIIGKLRSAEIEILSNEPFPSFGRMWARSARR